MPLRLKKKWNFTASRTLPVSPLFTFLNLHLIILPSSLVDSPSLGHMVEVMTINISQELKGKSFKRGKLLTSLHAISKSLRKSSASPLWSWAHSWSSNWGQVAPCCWWEGLVVGRNNLVSRKGVPQVAMKITKLLQLCPPLFSHWDMCIWEGELPSPWVISWWCWLPLLLMPFYSQAWNPFALLILAPQQLPLTQLVGSQKSLSDSCAFISPHLNGL